MDDRTKFLKTLKALKDNGSNKITVDIDFLLDVIPGNTGPQQIELTPNNFDGGNFRNNDDES